MKTLILKNNLMLYIIGFITSVILSSCSTGKTITSGDGIYGETPTVVKEEVVETKKQPISSTQENQFTKELNRLEELNGSDIVTDIETYKSDDIITKPEEVERPSNEIEYNNRPWGSSNSNSDVIVNISTFPRYGFYNDWYWNNSYNWGYNYGFNVYRPWRYRWGFNSLWHPYHSPYYWRTGYYSNIGFYNDFYYSRYRYPYYRTPSRRRYRTHSGRYITDRRSYNRNNTYSRRLSTRSTRRSRTYSPRRTYKPRTNKSYNNSRKSYERKSSNSSNRRRYESKSNSNRSRTYSPRKTYTPRRNSSSTRSGSSNTRSYSPRSNNSSRSRSSNNTRSYRRSR